ncbi:hypothetical protein LINPERPRIM_LOCUS13168 [Linum perenne]
MFCDGSFSTVTTIVDGKAGTLVCASPIVAEAKTLLEVIKKPADLGGAWCIKTDCLNLVDALRKSPSFWPWKCSAWLQIMSETLKVNTQIRVSFIPRALNSIADKIAKAATDGSLPED